MERNLSHLNKLRSKQTRIDLILINIGHAIISPWKILIPFEVKNKNYYEKIPYLNAFTSTYHHNFQEPMNFSLYSTSSLETLLQKPDICHQSMSLQPHSFSAVMTQINICGRQPPCVLSSYQKQKPIIPNPENA